jgi:hypothetical protein
MAIAFATTPRAGFAAAVFALLIVGAARAALRSEIRDAGWTGRDAGLAVGGRATQAPR